MSRGRRIALNTTWLSMAQIAGAAAGIFVVGKVAELLGPEGYGEVEGAISFVTLFTPIIFAGIQLILIRDICARPQIAARAVGDALLIRAALLPIFVGSVLAVASFRVLDEISWAVLLLAIINGFLVYYLQCFELAFEAFERMHYIAIAVLVCYAIGMSGSLVAVTFELGPTGVMAARALGVAGQLLTLAITLRRVLFRPKLEIDLRRYLRTLRLGAPLLVSVALNLFLLELGRVMLLATCGLVEVGLYSSAASLSSKFLMFVHALTQAVQPGLCKAWNDGKEEYTALLGRAMRFVLILTLPMAAGSFFVASELIGFIFGDQYVEAGPVMAVLMCAIHLQFLSHLLNAAIVARGKEMTVALGAAIAVAANIAVGVVIIPRLGPMGAGLTTVASQAVLVGFFLIIQRDCLGDLFRRLKLVRVLLANALLVGLCWLLRDQSALLIIGAAVPCYGATVLSLRCIDRDELRAVTGR